MSRTYNTDQRGRYFSEEQKLAVWQKAAVAPGLWPTDFRLDDCGALIEWSKFGITVEKNAGWEIDHIIPVAHNGSDDLTNLQALQWQHNRHKGDSVGSNYCFLSRSV